MDDESELDPKEQSDAYINKHVSSEGTRDFTNCTRYYMSDYHGGPMTQTLWERRATQEQLEQRDARRAQELTSAQPTCNQLLADIFLRCSDPADPAAQQVSPAYLPGAGGLTLPGRRSPTGWLLTLPWRRRLMRRPAATSAGGG